MLCLCGEFRGIHSGMSLFSGCFNHEILCKADGEREITNQPLASTWRFGLTPEEDRQLEEDHVAHEKERSRHVMLVDLGSSKQNFCGLG